MICLVSLSCLPKFDATKWGTSATTSRQAAKGFGLEDKKYNILIINKIRKWLVLFVFLVFQNLTQRNGGHPPPIPSCQAAKGFVLEDKKDNKYNKLIINKIRKWLVLFVFLVFQNLTQRNGNIRHPSPHAKPSSRKDLAASVDVGTIIFSTLIARILRIQRKKT